jgi:serine/threonine protein kinase
MVPLDLPAGSTLRGKYRIESVLGEGGMGRVLLATHLWLDQKVAIKVLREAALAMPNVVERFAREARASAKIKHEHVVRVLDVDEAEDGMPFMVMEYLEGGDLGELIKTEGALPTDYAVGLILEACEGVAEAHALGIVHRDIKPSNLFLAKQGAEAKPVLKLLDFGISKSTATEDLAITGTMMALGSPRYMAPEQLRGLKNVDHRADIWSLGVVLYQMVTGVLPFHGESITEVAARIAADPPPPPSRFAPGVSPAIEEAILRCLEKRPKDRFDSAMELAASLSGPVSLLWIAQARPPAPSIPEDEATLRTLPISEGEMQAISSHHLVAEPRNVADTIPPAAPPWQPRHPGVAPQSPGTSLSRSRIATTTATAVATLLVIAGLFLLRGQWVAERANTGEPAAIRGPAAATAATRDEAPSIRPAPPPSAAPESVDAGEGMVLQGSSSPLPPRRAPVRSPSSKETLELELK